MPFASYVALVRAAKDLCGDPALPMRFAEAVDTSEFSVVGLLSLASETMLDSLMQLNRYGQLVVEVCEEYPAGMARNGWPACGDEHGLGRGVKAVTSRRWLTNIFAKIDAEIRRVQLILPGTTKGTSCWTNRFRSYDARVLVAKTTGRSVMCASLTN